MDHARAIASRRSAVRLLLLGAPGLVGCAHAGHTTGTGHAPTSGPWDRGTVPGAGLPYFYRAERGRPTLVVLHEILGLTAGCLGLGQDLWRSGFSVYLPLLFGELGGHSFLSGYFKSCRSGRFSCGAARASSAILPSIQALCEHVSEVSGSPRIGVIGMCLTGSFPLWLMRSPVVTAPVLCQPTMPFSLTGAGDPTALGLSDDDLRLAVSRRDVSILGLRYTGDWRCPMQRFTRLSELFGRRFQAFEIPSGVGNAPDGHSVLVGSRWPPAYDRTVGFLTDRLR